MEREFKKLVFIVLLMFIASLVLLLIESNSDEDKSINKYSYEIRTINENFATKN